MCSARNTIFLDDSSFLKQSVHHPFFGQSGNCPSSSRHIPCGTHLCICACFCIHVHFYNGMHKCTRNGIHNHMNDLFLLVKGLNPWPCSTIFLSVQGLSPYPCSTTFLWVQGSIPWPWLPVLRPLYPWTTSLAPTNGATGGTANKKALIRGKNLSAFLVALAVWGSRKISTCITKA